MIGIVRGEIGIEMAIVTTETGEEHTPHHHPPHERPSPNTPSRTEIEEQIPLLREGHRHLPGTTVRGERVQRGIIGIVGVDGRMRGVIGTGIGVLLIVEEGAMVVIDVVGIMIEIGRGIGVRRPVVIGMIVIEMVGDIGGMIEIVGGDLVGIIVIE